MKLFLYIYRYTGTKKPFYYPFTPNILRMALWSFLLLFLIGCVHFEQAVTFRDDASMKVAYHYSVPEEYVPALKASKKIIEKKQGFNSANTTLRWPLNKALALKMFNTDRTTLKTYNTWEEDNRKHVNIIFITEKINGLEDNPARPRITVSKENSNRQKNKYKLQFTLVTADTESKKIGDHAKKSLTRLLKGLRLKLTLKTPGKIVKTTGELIQQNTAQWNYRVEEQQDNSWLWKTPAINAVFETETELFNN